MKVGIKASLYDTQVQLVIYAIPVDSIYIHVESTGITPVGGAHKNSSPNQFLHTCVYIPLHM